MEELIIPTIVLVILVVGLVVGDAIGQNDKEGEIKKSCGNYGQYVMGDYRLTCEKRGK